MIVPASAASRQPPACRKGQQCVQFCLAGGGFRPTDRRGRTVQRILFGQLCFLFFQGMQGGVAGILDALGGRQRRLVGRFGCLFRLVQRFVGGFQRGGGSFYLRLLLRFGFLARQSGVQRALRAASTAWAASLRFWRARSDFFLPVRPGVLACPGRRAATAVGPAGRHTGRPYRLLPAGRPGSAAAPTARVWRRRARPSSASSNVASTSPAVTCCPCCTGTPVTSSPAGSVNGVPPV